MNFIRLVFVLLLAWAQAISAGVNGDDLPGNSAWYLHVDFEQIRDSETSRGLYQFINEEISVDVLDETGIDLSNDIDKLTAFSADEAGTVLLIEGDISDEAQDKLMELASEETEITEKKHKGRTYFHGGHEHADAPGLHDNEPLGDLEDGGYFSFALRNKLVVTASEAQMQELLDNKGRITGGGNHGNAVFVLTADKSLVQAGARTDGLADDEDDWDSNILRNTEQVALLIADTGEAFSVEAKLIATEPQLAQSLAGIVGGLIGMQAFNSELDPQVKGVIASTKVDVEENVLSISAVIAPGLIEQVLND